jgi:hypothetical protein
MVLVFGTYSFILSRYLNLLQLGLMIGDCHLGTSNYRVFGGEEPDSLHGALIG